MAVLFGPLVILLWEHTQERHDGCFVGKRATTLMWRLISHSSVPLMPMLLGKLMGKHVLLSLIHERRTFAKAPQLAGALAHHLGCAACGL